MFVVLHVTMSRQIFVLLYVVVSNLYEQVMWLIDYNNETQ
jgi:hypothetical protein